MLMPPKYRLFVFSKCVLCFSPVGTTLRIRGRKFPAVVNCTSIDLFQAWPEEALVSVSNRFLSEVELISVILSACLHMWDMETSCIVHYAHGSKLPRTDQSGLGFSVIFLTSASIDTVAVYIHCKKGGVSLMMYYVMWMTVYTPSPVGIFLKCKLSGGLGVSWTAYT